MTAPRPEPSTLPELAALESALGALVVVLRPRVALARELQEVMRGAARTGAARMGGVSLVGDEEELLLAVRLRPVAEGLLAVSVAADPVVADYEAAARRLIRRVAAGGLSSEHQVGADEALAGIFLVPTLLGGSGAQQQLAALLDDDGYRHRELQAGFDVLTAAFRRFDDQHKSLLRFSGSVPAPGAGLSQAGFGAPTPSGQFAELTALLLAVNRWGGTLRGWTLATQAFGGAMAVVRAELPRLPARPDRQATRRMTAALTPAAHRLRQLATDYADRTTDLDAALSALFARLSAGDVGPTEGADARRLLGRLRNLAAGAAVSDNSTAAGLGRLADQLGGGVGRSLVLALSAFELYEAQQPLIAGWARLPVVVASAAGPDAESFPQASD